MPHPYPTGDRWREDRKRKLQTNGAFVTPTDGNSGNMYKNGLEMKRRKKNIKKGSVQCYLRPHMNAI